MIVDYKTDAWSSEEELGAKAERYAVQMRAYSDAVGAVMGERVARSALVFAASSATERDIA